MNVMTRGRKCKRTELLKEESEEGRGGEAEFLRVGSTKRQVGCANRGPWQVVVVTLPGNETEGLSYRSPANMRAHSLARSL